MGMYTELVFKADLNEEKIKDVLDVINYIFNNGELPAEVPDHEFFRCDRWKAIAKCNSYYHIPWTDARYDEGYAFTRCDLKDYANEIDKFVDWITSYLDDGIKCVGYKWYEEDDLPELLLVNT